MDVQDFIRSHAVAFPNMVKFALAMAILVGVPALCRRIRIPGVLGLLLTGVVIGPHVLGLFAEHLGPTGKTATHVFRWPGD